jgi:hypothetical protein
MTERVQHVADVVVATVPLLLRVQRLLCVAERVRGLLCVPVLVGGLLLRVAVRRRLCVALPHGGPHGQSRPHQCCLGEIHQQFPPLPPLPAPADPPSISILEPSLTGFDVCTKLTVRIHDWIDGLSDSP